MNVRKHLSTATLMAMSLVQLHSGGLFIALDKIERTEASNGNLIVNGDFELGSVGFTTQYHDLNGHCSGRYSPDEGQILITNNPNRCHSFYGSASGRGNMLVANTAPTQRNIWCQTVAVQPNATYELSYDLRGAVYSPNDNTTSNKVRWKINGVTVPGASSIQTPHQFTTFTNTWNSGNNTTAHLCIENLDTAAITLDTVLDNIGLELKGSVTPPSPSGTFQCNNGLDDDNDGGIDHISVVSTDPKLCGELIKNGNFNQGNSFNEAVSSSNGYGQTSLTNCSRKSNLPKEGNQGVTTNPARCHSFYGSVPSGFGNVLVSNTAPSQRDIWCQTVAVQPNATYELSYNLRSAVYSPNDNTTSNKVRWTINGVTVPGASSIQTPHQFTTFTNTWISGNSTTAKICLKNLDTAAITLDTLVDDIGFKQSFNSLNSSQNGSCFVNKNPDLQCDSPEDNNEGPDVVVPNPPVCSLQTISFENGMPTIEWNPIDNATSYQVQVDGGSAQTVNGTSFTTNRLTAGSHTIAVRSVNSAGQSSYCTRTIMVNQCQDGIDNNDPEDTLADRQDPGCFQNGNYNPLDDDEQDPITVPTVPTCSVASVNFADGRPTLNWNAVSGATSYEVQVDNSNTFELTGLSHQFNRLLTGDRTLQVRAKNSAGVSQFCAAQVRVNQCQDGIDNSDPEDSIADFPNDPGCQSLTDDNEVDPITVPGTPVCTIPNVSFTGGTPTVTWQPVAGATDYRVKINNGPLQTVTGTSFTASRLNAGNYTFFVQARNSAGAGNFCTQPVKVHQCQDGADTDNDGAIDLDDFSCSGPTDDDETNPKSECQDGQDNDNNGLTDFPADPGCDSKQDNDEDGHSPQARLTLNKDVVGSTSIEAGNRVTYRFTVENSVDFSNATNVVVTDSIPAGLTFVYPGVGSTTDSRCTKSGTNVRCSLGNVNSGTHTANVQFTVDLPTNCTQTSITNSATLTADGAIIVDASDSAVLTRTCPHIPECRDGIDNDNNGFTDFPNDPGCTSSNDDDEDGFVHTPECSDGQDNDNNGLTDFPADLGCSSSSDDDESGYTPQCRDGIDNDSDGATDFPADFSCNSRNDNDERNPKSQCQDGIDNDNNGTTDFPADLGCNSKQDNTENGYQPECSDGNDNDGNGLTDFPTDLGCSSPTDNSERGYNPAVCGNGTVEQGETCDDGVHNGQPNRCNLTCDGTTVPVCGNDTVEQGETCDDGVLNGTPNQCNLTCTATTAPVCGNDVIELNETCDDGNQNGTPGKCNNMCTGTVPLPQCSDTIDNDGDGLIDFPADPGCSSPSDNSEFNSPAPQCSDGIDNDGDGDVDFPADPGCDNATDNNEGDGNTDFVIAKVGPSSFSGGDIVTYTITVTNQGPDNASSEFAFRDIKPDGLTYLHNNTLCTENGTTITCRDNNLDVGEARDYELTFRVSTNTVFCGRVIVNQALMSATPQGDPNHSNNTSSKQSTILCQTPVYQCSDGLDNDGDGLVDFPADPGCTSTQDNDEYNAPAPQCSDGIDNDVDGLIDFPADPGCANGQDNDEADTLADLQIQVQSAVPTVPLSGTAAYVLRVTNIGSGAAVNTKVEYTLPTTVPLLAFAPNASDSNCSVANGKVVCNGIALASGASRIFRIAFTPAQNTQAVCGQQVSLAFTTSSDTPDPFLGNNTTTTATMITCAQPLPQCSDGIDNDGDGLIDFPTDPGCTSTQDNDETNAPAPQCSDGLDNDGDGLIDFPTDPGCTSAQDDDEFNQVDACSDGVARVTVDLQPSVAVANVQETFTFNVVLTELDGCNNEQVDRVTLSLDNDLEVVQVSDSGSTTGDVVTWLNLPITSAGDVLSVQIRGKEGTPDGTVTRNVALSGQSSDTEFVTIRDQSSSSSSSPMCTPDLDIEIDDDPDLVTPGDNVEYEVRVRNRSADCDATVRVTGFFDRDDLRFVSATRGGVQDPSDDDEVLWAMIDVDSNDRETLRVTFELDDSVTKDQVSFTAVAQDGAERDEATEYTDVRDTVDNESDGELEVRKTASRQEVRSGTEVSYEVTVYNRGETVIEDITVRDTLDSDMRLTTAGNGRRSGNGIEWTINRLAVGDSVNFRYRAELFGSHNSRILNTVTASSDDSNTATDSVEVRIIEFLPVTGSKFTRDFTGSSNFTTVAASTATLATPLSESNLPFILWSTVITMGVSIGSVFGKKFI